MTIEPALRVVAQARLERRRFVVVAADVAEAAERAVKALQGRQDGPWEVRGVRRLAEAL